VDGEVLVVEDDDEIRSLYSAMLEEAGLPFRCAPTSAAALGGSARPLCVILDWELPDGSGLDVARALHRRWGRSLPIIVITGTPLQAQDIRAARAARYFRKPFDPQDVLQNLSEIIARSREHRFSQRPADLPRAD